MTSWSSTTSWSWWGSFRRLRTSRPPTGPRRPPRPRPEGRTSASSRTEVLGLDRVQELPPLPPEPLWVAVVLVVVTGLDGQQDAFGVHQVVGHVQRGGRPHGDRHRVRRPTGHHRPVATPPQVQLGVV